MHWLNFINKVGVSSLWLVIWGGALIVPFLPPPALGILALGAWISVLMLAPGRWAGFRLLKMATYFLVVWSILAGLIHLVYPTSLRPIGNLVAWLALGLHLMLAKTPLELALEAGRRLTPFVGRLRAQKMALSLALLARLIPHLLNSALNINTTVSRRARGLSLIRRLTLLTQAILRDSLSQNEDMSRALLKRWPW